MSRMLKGKIPRAYRSTVSHLSR